MTPPVTRPSGVTDVERGWLAYAREVVGDLAHRSACAGLGGSPDHPGVDATDLRWPGYLGEKAVAGRAVLCIGNVHRDFASGELRVSHRDQLVDATRAWRDGRLPDAAYLDVTRRVYLAGLHAWAVGTHLRAALDVLGRDVFDIAYTNAARCQYPELPPPLPRAASTKVALQRLCLQRFPVSRLERLLAPHVLLFTSTTAYDGWLAVEPERSAPAVCMHPRNGLLARPLALGDGTLPTGTRRDEWASALADHRSGRGG